MHHRFTRYGVDALENSARQLLNLPQRQPSVAGPTGQVSRIDEQLRRAHAANEAGRDLRYDKVTYTEPERVEYDLLGLFDDEVIPAQQRVAYTDRPEMFRALGEETIDDLIKRGGSSYQAPSTKPVRKAGLGKEDLQFTEKDIKTIDAAKGVIQKHLNNIGMVGAGATAGGMLISGFADDGDSGDNLQDAMVTAGLLGAGGYSGYHAAGNTYRPMSETMAVQRQQRGDTTPIQGRVFARDAKNRAARGRTGAAVGAGAGALLGLIGAMKTDEPQVYVY